MRILVQRVTSARAKQAEVANSKAPNTGRLGGSELLGRVEEAKAQACGIWRVPVSQRAFGGAFNYSTTRFVEFVREYTLYTAPQYLENISQF